MDLNQTPKIGGNQQELESFLIKYCNRELIKQIGSMGSWSE